MADLNELNEKVEQIKADIREQLEKIENTKGVYEYKKTILDKNGIIGGLMKQMGSVPKEEKADFGKKVNELKNWASEHFDELNTKLKEKEMELRYESEKIDISMPAKSRKTGNLHPVTQVRNQLIDIFASMGFSVYEGTEIETDYYNFTALNTPQDHPARDMQDTFYLSPEFLLRTQTSAGQVHVMESQKPPIKILSPGKVFRSDDDATHSPMFTQMEGLVVDKTITLCDLKGMLEVLVQKIFGEGTTTRLRPSYFPFTEPSVEVDVSCFACGGCGCRLCKGTEWIEVLGAGIVNKKVLENCGIDSEEYLRVRDIRKDIDKIRASASLPLVARNVKIDGKLYLDGGISDAIPLGKSILDGNRKNIVVMTKEVGFVRKPASASQLGLIKLRYLKYPKV